MATHRAHRKRTAADYFFGETGKYANLSRSAKRELKHKRRGKRSLRTEATHVHRKKTMRVKGRDVESNRAVFIKFRASNPGRTLKRLINKGALNIIRVRT